jgi:hypothetical protein
MERKEPEQRTHYSYDALLGTLRACKEQTVSYPWDLQLQAIEETITAKLPRLCRFSSRDLPACILEGCLDFFRLAQSLPKDRLVRIKTHTGYATLAAWAHKVSGLTVTILDHQGDESISATFGAGEDNVVIVVGGPNINISLLDGSSEELFQFVSSPDDPVIGAEERCLVAGIGARLLRRDPELDPTRGIQSLMFFCECKRSDWVGGGPRPSLQKLQSTSKLVLGDLFDSEDAYSKPDYDKVVAGAQRQNELALQARQDASSPLRHSSSSQWFKHGVEDEPGIVPLQPSRLAQKVAKIMLALTCVANQEDLGKLPVTTSTIPEIEGAPMRQSFDFLSALILGHDYNEITTIGKDKVALVSACRWSLYVSTIGLPDPLNVTPNEFRIAQGVPYRHGERKQFIIDGPTLNISTGGEFRNSEPHSDETLSTCLLDTSKPQVFVGVSRSAFEVLVKFEFLDHVDNKIKSLRCGFRALNEAVWRAPKTEPCPHSEPALENHKLAGDCKSMQCCQ